jgi:5'-3' exonuclease
MTIPIILHQDKGLVLVDTGYYRFNRYFASLIWYRKVKKGAVDIASLHEDTEFMVAVRRHVLNDILCYATYPYQTKPFKKSPVPKNRKIRNKVIFCVDCPRASIWRMGYYKAYKGTRSQDEDVNMQALDMIYEYINEQCISATIDGLDVMKLNAERLEADDVVYLTLNHARIAGYMPHVLVITNDNDFLQLVPAPLRATVVNAKAVDLSARAHHDPATSTMLKVLLGDQSDNIKAVPGVGSEKQALALTGMTETQRRSWIKEHADLRAYKLNKKLISLSAIPRHWAQKFTLKYTLTVETN